MDMGWKRILFAAVGIYLVTLILPALLTAILPSMSNALGNFSDFVDTYVPGLGAIFDPSVFLKIVVILIAAAVLYMLLNKAEQMGGAAGGNRGGRY